MEEAIFVWCTTALLTGKDSQSVLCIRLFHRASIQQPHCILPNLHKGARATEPEQLCCVLRRSAHRICRAEQRIAWIRSQSPSAEFALCSGLVQNGLLLFRFSESPWSSVEQPPNYCPYTMYRCCGSVQNTGYQVLIKRCSCWGLVVCFGHVICV